MIKAVTINYQYSGSCYIATSPDVPGLVVEESSEAEMRERAKMLVRVLLDHEVSLVFVPTAANQ